MHSWYPKNTREEFADCVFTNQDAKYSYSFVRDVIGDFRGDVEKLYPCFIAVSPDDIVFKYLSRRTSMLPGFKVANYLKGRNFRGKNISRISRILIKFAKLNSHENCSKPLLAKLNSSEIN